MSKPKLTYFDAPVSRGEECRLALHLAGIDFDDNRIKFADWGALKPNTPFGSMPVLELPGHPPLAHSNAILVLLGRRHGLHPKDDFEAAQHEAMMCHVEDMRLTVGPTMRIKDEAEKKRVREDLAANYLPTWASFAEKQVQATKSRPFYGSDSIHVVDLKVFMAVKWFLGGALDHIPTSVLDPFTNLVRVHDAVRDHAAVKAWYAKH
jgi:glutathione S-transferase